MVDQTPYHELNKYEQGEPDWSHGDTVDRVDEELPKTGTLSGRPADPPEGSYYRAEDVRIAFRYDPTHNLADGDGWVAVAGLGTSANPVPGTAYLSNILADLLEISPDGADADFKLNPDTGQDGTFKFQQAGDDKWSLHYRDETGNFEYYNYVTTDQVLRIVADTNEAIFPNGDVTVEDGDLSVSGSIAAATAAISGAPTDPDDVTRLADIETKADLTAAGGVVVSDQIPDLAITETNTVADETERLALDVEEGDVAIQQDNDTTYIFTGGDPSVDSNWSKFVFEIGDGSINTTQLSDDAVTAAKIAAAAVQSEQIDTDAVTVDELASALGTDSANPIPGTTHLESVDVTTVGADSVDTDAVENQDYNEAVETHATASGTVTVDLAVANVHRIEAIDNVTIAFSNVSSAPPGNSLLLKFTDDDAGGPYTITWPASVIWANGDVRNEISASGNLRVSLETDDGGTEWWAVRSGEDFA